MLSSARVVPCACTGWLALSCTSFWKASYTSCGTRLRSSIQPSWPPSVRTRRKRRCFSSTSTRSPLCTVPILLYIVATRSRRLVSGADTYMYWCCTSVARLHAEASASKTNAVAKQTIALGWERGDFTGGTEHYKSVDRGWCSVDSGKAGARKSLPRKHVEHLVFRTGETVNLCNRPLVTGANGPRRTCQVLLIAKR